MFATLGNLWTRRAGAVLFGAMALAIGAQPAMGKDSLQQVDDSVVALVRQVSPAVVQILVTRFGAVEPHGQTALIGHQRTSRFGSHRGPGGYIVTNAHVVQARREVRVVLFSSENINSPHATFAQTDHHDARARLWAWKPRPTWPCSKLKPAVCPPFRSAVSGPAPGPDGVCLWKPGGTGPIP